MSKTLIVSPELIKQGLKSKVIVKDSAGILWWICGVMAFKVEPWQGKMSSGSQLSGCSYRGDETLGEAEIRT